MLSALGPEEVSRVASLGVDYDGQIALHYAAQNGHSAVVEALLAQLQPKAVVVRTKYEAWSSLHLAAKEGHEEVVRLLLGNMSREDITAQDSGLSGPTCLYAAAELGCEEAVKSILQELGASYCVGQNIRAYGWEMLTTAVKGVAGLQLADMAIKVSLGLGSPEISQDNAKGLGGLTALHWAVRGGV